MKKRIAILLSLVMLIVTAGCGSDDATEASGKGTHKVVSGVPCVEDPIELEMSDALGKTKFEDMKYEHFDPTALNATIDSLRADMAANESSDVILDGFDDILDELQVMYLSYELAETYSYIDATDEYYQTELEYVTNLCLELDDKVNLLGKDILDSAYGDAARDAWDPADVEYYSEYVAMTEEQKNLQNQETSLSTQYKALSVQEYTIDINGKTYSMDNLAEGYYAGDITYDQYVDGYYAILDSQAAAIGPIYVEMVKVRQQIATAYGYANYNDYAYDKTYNRDYTVEEAEAFCQSVKDYLVGEYESYSFRHMNDDTDSLDQASSEYSPTEQLSLIQKYMANVHPILADHFQYMLDYNLYDIEDSPNKMDAGFTIFLNAYNQPFYYGKPSGVFYDVMTSVHEFGHFNSYCIDVEDENAHQNLDLAEIHSQGLEMLYTHFYGDMFDDKDLGELATNYTINQRVASVLEGCLFDEFQREVYLMENPTLEDINACFGKVASEYYPSYYSPNESSTVWINVNHNFESPLYYISYATSVVPALEIWAISQKDFSEAAHVYIDVVCAGQKDGYKAVLEKVGLGTPFEEETIIEIAEMLKDL